MAKVQKEKKDKLECLVSFRLTKKDHSKYLEKVEASGMKPSAFFRGCVLENRTQIVAKKKPSHDKARLVYLFNKVSNNINQLAHRAHIDYNAGVIGESSYTTFIQELELLSRYMKAVIKDVD